MQNAPPKSDNATHGQGSREWSRPCPSAIVRVASYCGFGESRAGDEAVFRGSDVKCGDEIDKRRGGEVDDDVVKGEGGVAFALSDDPNF